MDASAALRTVYLHQATARPSIKMPLYSPLCHAYGHVWRVVEALRKVLYTAIREVDGGRCSEPVVGLEVITNSRKYIFIPMRISREWALSPTSMGFIEKKMLSLIENIVQ